MTVDQSVGIIKEQLRIKTVELKKRETEKRRQEVKIRRILELSQKRIRELHSQIQQKEELLRSPSLAALRYHKEDQKTEVQEDRVPRSPDRADPKVEVETREVPVPDPRLVDALKNLRQENRALKNHLEDEKKEKKQYAKEKEILIKEIKNLRKRPQSVEELKSEVNEFESRSRENQSRYQDLLTEYNTLTQSYEKILTDQSGKDEEERLPEKIIQELEEELQELKNEKKELQKELNDEKRLFEISLAREIRRIEKDWENKIKRLKTEKIRVTRFADQIIEEGEAPVWLITYSDMATLLLTFFILYYSIAAVNLDRFKEAILGTEEASIGLLELLDSLEIEESIQEFTGLKSDNILSDITDVVQTQGDVGTSESKIVVRVPGATLFPSGSAALQKSGQPVLDEVIRIFKKYQRYKIHIQGHTDDIPISTDRFPTNWELSAARATAVLRYFIDRGIEAERLTATGYADTFPLVPNETPIGRAKNRRVEFVLEKE